MTETTPPTRHVLLVGPGREIHPKVAELPRLRLSVLCTAKSVATMPTHRLYRRIVGVPVDAGAEEWIAQARLIHKLDPVDAIGGFNELTQVYAAAIADDLGLAYVGADTIRLTRDKFAMRDRLRDAGIDDVLSARVTTAGEVLAFAEENGYPIVLKPVDGRGSLGVATIHGPDDVAPAVARFEQYAADAEMLVEQFIVGEEYSVEAISEDGMHRVAAITRKYKDQTTLVETGHVVPAPLPDEVATSIGDYVASCLEAIGLRSGASHTEVIVTSAGPRVVETHARLGGDSIVELVELSTGVDLDDLWIRQSLGERVIDAMPTGAGRAAAVAFASPAASGTLERVDGVEEARALPYVERVEVIAEIGGEVEPAYDSLSRGAFAIAVAETSEEAWRRAQEAVSGLRFVVACPG